MFLDKAPFEIQQTQTEFHYCTYLHYR